MSGLVLRRSLDAIKGGLGAGTLAWAVVGALGYLSWMSAAFYVGLAIGAMLVAGGKRTTLPTPHGWLCPRCGTIHAPERAGVRVQALPHPALISGATGMTEFVNVSGRHVRDLARGIMELLDTPFEEGMQADLAAHVLVVTAVDLWRANYGDDQAADALKKAIDRRLSKPVEFWGGRVEGR